MPWVCLSNVTSTHCTSLDITAWIKAKADKYSFTKRSHSNKNVCQLAQNRHSKNSAPSCLILSGWAKLAFLRVRHHPSIMSCFLSVSLALCRASSPMQSRLSFLQASWEGSCEGLSASVTSSVINSLLPLPSPSKDLQQSQPSALPINAFLCVRLSQEGCWVRGPLVDLCWQAWSPLCPLI